MQQIKSVEILDLAIGVGVPNPRGLPSHWSRARIPAWNPFLYDASNGDEHHFHPATSGTFNIAAAMVGVVSQLGKYADPTDARAMTVKVEQWQYLAEQIRFSTYVPCFELRFWTGWRHFKASTED